MGTKTRGLRRLMSLTAFILPATLILSACGGEQSTSFSKIGSGLSGTSQNFVAAESTATTGAGMPYSTVTSAMAADSSLKQTAPTGTEQQEEPGPEIPLPPVQVSNPFVDTVQDHLSTFAMDVDTGSYTAARNYIRAGSLPPGYTVRVEEFVNYFRYNYPAPQEGAFGINIDGARSPFGQGDTQIVRVGIQGKRIEAAERKDAVLTFVIDVSGSMQEPNRLPLVKEALRLLVNELNQGDQVGIVVYGSEARVLLEHTTAADKDRILAAIDSLNDEGSTNAEAGLRLGYDLASKHFKTDAINRVILCSDGVANVGETGPDAIRAKIRDYTAQGMYLTTVGFGMGDYNDYLMEQLADDGNGSYAYVDSLNEAKRIFVENLTGTLQVIAKDAKIQVDFNPAVVARYRLIGYENRAVADSDFRNDKVDAGEVGAGHSVTALYEVELTKQGGDGPAMTVQVRYADPADNQVREISKPFSASEFGTSIEQTSAQMQLAVAAAGFAEELRSESPMQYPYANEVMSLAQRAATAMPQDEDVQEFAQLVSIAINPR